MEPVKGFRDFTGEEAEKRQEIRKIIVGTFEKYGFEPVETPVVEFEEFVKGNNSQDEAVSDIFKLQDKGKRNLALRYEFTFQLKRLMNNKKLPFKRYQIGEVFRDEPISGNRFRQFIQCDADIIGASIKDDAELLALAVELMKNLGIDAEICINNRELINEILQSEGITNNKEQILREIDKLEKIPEKEIKSNLKAFKAEKVLDIIKKPKRFFEKFESFRQIAELLILCKDYNIDKFVKFEPSLIRGLSYYNKNIWEIKTKKIKETISAGGSFMFNNVQCTGISFGLDRLAILSSIKPNKEKFLVVSLGEDKKAIQLCKKLRESGKIVSMFYGKPSKALEFANSYNYNKVIFVGEQEVKSKQFKVKDMTTGRESVLKI